MTRGNSNSKRLRTAIRKAAKWGGAVVTVLLLVVWIGSPWWYAGIQSLRNKNRVDVDVGHGVVGVVWARPVDAFGPRFLDWQFERNLHDKSDHSLWRDVRGQWFYRNEGPPLSRRRLTIVVLPIWAPLVVVLAGTSLVWRADIRAMRRASVGLCVKCGYNLAGTAAGAVCPECGKARSA